MTLDILIIFAGSFVAALPFLGFPSSWDTALFFLVGIFIIGLGIAVQRRGDTRGSAEKRDAMSVENSIRKSEHESR
ncbi:MAG: hypothetical protein UY61_C0056G0012 [Candidatus Adlerbacteria bacterium GW2011_GWC1_50_9]|uniref:Uncharacterized protein n=1 Tax=Candidatus Adlerbacteria bacterium GW2011_GWC1_50_9 TaxID=1618608 RepID=A0A0G1ZJF2_9BACT|nr:MAG: hypothetical protein UY61_C0056G0012 [Candidatus Adlerbacteria bacterium GW2011_GWC1_50_9]